MEPLHEDDPERIGPYRLLGRLGTGGMGLVYLARTPAGHTVALKVIRRVPAAHAPRYRLRFQREFDAARRTNGQRTPPILDADPTGSSPWLVTPYLPGLSLGEAVDDFGPLPAESVRALAAGLAEALIAIHGEGVVHRDVKPDNVMLTAHGPQVIDFGIARPADATTFTRPHVPIGTPGYRSPEQIRGEKAGPRSDVFSLGVTLAYAASGREPFGFGTGAAKDHRVLTGRSDLAVITDPWLLDLIKDCLRQCPQDRPSAAEVLNRVRSSAMEAVSPRGTGWLPPEVAQEILRRTREADAIAASRLGMRERTEQDGTLSRRTLLAGVGATVLLAGAADTPVRLQNPSPVNGPRPRSARVPPIQVTERWRRRGSKDFVELSVADGVLLAQVDNAVRALDPHTGTVLWSRDNIGAFITTVADVAYMTDGRRYPRRPGRVYAVQGASGRILWAYRPTFDESAVYGVTVTDSVACFGYSRLCALNAHNGRKLWARRINRQGHLSAAEGTVVVPTPAAMVGLDAETGRLKWKSPMEYGNYPLAVAGLAFVTDRWGTLHALRLHDGTTVWRRNHPGGYGEWSKQYRNGLLYIEGNDGEVLAIHAATGEPAWTRRLAAFENDSRKQSTALSLFGDTLYVPCADGRLHALDTADGHTRWTYDAHKTKTMKAMSIDGLVFIDTVDGYIQALAPVSASQGGSSGGA